MAEYIEGENPDYDQIRAKSLSAHRGRFGVLSTGEQVAAALVLNRADLLAEAGYTMAEAIDRVGDRWLPLVPVVARDLRNEGLI